MSYSDNAVAPEHPNKRTRQSDGTFDPLQARRLDVGFQSYKAIVDGDGIKAKMVETGGVLPPASYAASAIEYGDGLFAMENDPSPVPLVQKLINGHEAPFARHWPGDATMQMLALKQTIRPLGAAVEAVKVTPNNLSPQVGVKYMGLHSPWVHSCKNGARLLWDVKPFTTDLELNTDRNEERNNAYGLVLVAYSEETVGKQFNKMASELVNNSLTWERAMAGYYGKARPWLSAVLSDYRHCQTAAILLIERLLKEGILAVPGAPPTTNVVQRMPGNQVRQPVELQSATGYTSYEIAGRIANFMELTAPTDTLIGTIDNVALSTWKEISHQFAESLYYTANATSGGSLKGTVNGAVEFGAEFDAVQGPVFNGRHPDNQLKEDRIGAVVKLQCNHTAQAVSAFAQAAEQVDKFMAGTGLSSAPNHKALAFLHK